MKTSSAKTKNIDRSTKRLAERICKPVLIAMAFLITYQAVLAQAPRIPVPGADGNFSDMQVDGDRIRVLKAGSISQGKFRILLDSDSSWWKMLRVIDKNGLVYSIAQQNGRLSVMIGNETRMFVPNGNSSLEIELTNLDEFVKIQFWKAKFLGAHTYITSETFRARDLEGAEVTFNWRDGLEDGYSDQYEDATAPINESLTIDGSGVTIVSSTGGTAGQATIKFNTAVAWWTGVKTFERTGKAWLIEKVEGKYNPAHRTIRLPISSLPKEVKLELWTAKTFGVHTHMATKKVIRERFDGRVVTINWGPPPATAINETVMIDGKNATIVSSNTGKTGFVTIKFQTYLAWWTAIKFFDRAGRAKLITKVNGKYSPANRSLTIPIGSLPGNTKFEFWTAKAFGIQTHMTSRSFATERLDGRTITINWPR
jgi:hypothetical protein